MNELSATDNWRAQARQACTKAAIPITPKRLEVYAALLKAGHPISAYDLIDMLKQDFARALTPISIYRMLDFLEQKHLVRKLKSTGKYLAINRESALKNQAVSQFLICRHCGDVRELSVDRRILGELKACIDSSGFQLHNMELEWDCVCTSCSDAPILNNNSLSLQG